MAISDALIGFVKEGLQRGLPRAQIQDALLGAGWPPEHVRRALAGFAESEFPIPVPRPSAYLSARDAFMYAVLFTSLSVSSYYLADLLFELINRSFPDPAAQELARSTRPAIRWSVSSLIVAFPLFLYVTWVNARDIKRDPVKRVSKVRQQVTYLTLFLASLALVGDFTTLVYNVLGGELTVRFALKVITVAVIAGVVFTYYLSELRNDEGEERGSGA